MFPLELYPQFTMQQINQVAASAPGEQVSML
jgi:hypothetical protein